MNLDNGLLNYLDFHLDVSERIKLFLQKKMFSVELEVTNMCNLSCRYCYASANIKRAGLDHDTVIRTLDGMQKGGMREVGWIGGEPLLLKELELWMNAALDRGLQNVLYTNGVLINPEMAKKLTRYCVPGRIVIHLDSVEYDQWAEGQLHPSRDKFSHNLKALDVLNDAGYPTNRVIMSTPLSRSCYQTLDATMAYSVSRGVRFLNLIPLTPLGMSQDLEAFLSPAEIWDAMERRAKILEMPDLMRVGISEYCKQFQMTDISVNCEGLVLPYIDCFKPVGSIYEHDIDTLVSQHWNALSLADWATEDTLANKIRGHCGRCENGTWCFGNPVSRDPIVLGEPDADCILAQEDIED